MRTYFILLLCFLWLGCSEETPEDQKNNTLEVSSSAVKVSNTESSATIMITSNGDWNADVEADADWLTVSPSSGKGNGSIRILAGDNTQGDTRKGKVILSQNQHNTTATREIEVEQLGAAPDILLSYSADKLPFTGADVIVTVVSNIEWEESVDEQYDWITPIEEPDLRASFVTSERRFRIAPNADVERTGKITFRSMGNYTIVKTANFVQEASEAFLSIGQDEFVLPYKVERLSIPVDIGGRGTNYTVASPESWVTWDKEASTVSEVILSLEDNPTDFPRTAEVTITNVTLTEKITVFQYGKPNPRIGDDISVSPLAFPGAEGGGRFVTGGRGGTVYRVTNLLDYGRNETAIQGSLRYGLDMSGAKTIVFDVSGNIELKRKMSIVRPNASIIGQTAPGDGITLKNYQLEIGSDVDNIIVRFIRSRPGDEKSDHEDDGVSGRWFKKAIFDHVSASWSVDECLSFYGVGDFTAQWCIASESLSESQHEKGAHGYGGIWSGANTSFHHILLAHHGSRVPRIADLAEGGPTQSIDNHGYFDVRNNVYYNWSGLGQGAYGGAYSTFNMVNNYYKAGPATTAKKQRILSSDPSARIFVEGNVTTANSLTVTDNWSYGIWNEFFHTLNPTQEEKEAMKITEAYPFDRTTTHTAETAYLKVAEYAGASLRRDAVDKRIANELLTGTTTYKGSISGNPQPGIVDTVSDTEGYPSLKSLPALADSDKDGIPDIWELAYGLDPGNASDAGACTVDDMGRYSNLEVYFHNLVQHIVYYQNLDGTPMEKK